MFLGIRYFPIYSCKPNCITVKSFAFHIYKKHIMNNKEEWFIHWCSGNYPRFHLPAGIHPQFWIWCLKGRGISSASNRKFPRHLRAENRGRWWILIFKGWKKGLVASETIKKKPHWCGDNQSKRMHNWINQLDAFTIFTRCSTTCIIILCFWGKYLPCDLFAHWRIPPGSPIWGDWAP